MVRNILVLPGGKTISAGAAADAAIQSLTLTDCVNSGTELKCGSVCAAMIEGTLLVRGENPLSAGMEVTLCKEVDGKRYKMGFFYLEKPTVPTPGKVHFVGYDRVCWLDMDLTGWLSGLTAFPCTALSFARLVCQQCNVTLATNSFTNSAFPVERFVGTYTGRQLLGFVAELAGAYCHADANGRIAFGYYTKGGTVEPDQLYQGRLEKADYTVAALNSVNLRRGQTVYPDMGMNAYVISGNPILTGATDGLDGALSGIKSRIPYGYRPCTLECTERPDIRAGQFIVVKAPGGSFRTLVMEKVDKGGRSRITCTGSRTRYEPSAMCGRTVTEAVKEAVEGMTQQDVFNKLTNFGTVQGFYLQDGKLYINAELVQIVNLVASVLESVKDNSTLRIDGAALKMKCGEYTTIELNNSEEGWPLFYMVERKDGTMTNMMDMSPRNFRLGSHGGESGLSIEIDDTGKASLKLKGDLYHRRLGWKDNGDGTYSLIGS